MSAVPTREHGRRQKDSSSEARSAEPLTHNVAPGIPVAAMLDTSQAPFTGADDWLRRRESSAAEDELGGAPVPGDIDTLLRRRRGAGARLPAALSAQLESGFGADFSSVRIHADNEAGQAARRLQAQAFSYGSDLYFGDGHYQPGNAGGRELIAHELAHVVQATRGGASGSGGTTIGHANDPLEHEADTMAATALRRRVLGPTGRDWPLGAATLRRRVAEVIRRRWTSRRNLTAHYEKHGREYPGASLRAYERKADAVRSSGEHHETRDGRHYYYDAENNDFAAFTPDGKAMTVFKPSRRDGYWQSKKRE